MNLRSLYAPAGGVRSVFSAKVADYTQSRPDYPEALFETLWARCVLPYGAVIADVGAGTGILTQALLTHGQVALVWNDRVLDDPVHMALDEVFAEFGGEKRAALTAHEERSDVPRFYGSTQAEEFSWPHEHFLYEDRFLSLVFSRSYIPERNTPEGHQVAQRVRLIFQRFVENDTLTVRYRTVAVLGRPNLDTLEA